MFIVIGLLTKVYINEAIVVVKKITIKLATIEHLLTCYILCLWKIPFSRLNNDSFCKKWNTWILKEVFATSSSEDDEEFSLMPSWDDLAFKKDKRS